MVQLCLRFNRSCSLDGNFQPMGNVQTESSLPTKKWTNTNQTKPVKTRHRFPLLYVTRGAAPCSNGWAPKPATASPVSRTHLAAATRFNCSDGPIPRAFAASTQPLTNDTPLFVDQFVSVSKSPTYYINIMCAKVRRKVRKKSSDQFPPAPVVSGVRAYVPHTWAFGCSFHFPR